MFLVAPHTAAIFETTKVPGPVKTCILKLPVVLMQLPPVAATYFGPDVISLLFTGFQPFVESAYTNVTATPPELSVKSTAEPSMFDPFLAITILFTPEF